MEIRSYRREDLDAMVALDERCFAPVFLFDQRSMRRFAEAPRARTIVAEVSPGVFAGFVITHLELSSKGFFQGYCVTLDVAPEQRGIGLGAELLRHAEEAMAARDAVQMILHVHTGNEAAIAFYSRQGYIFKRRVFDFYGPGLDAFVYAKPISPRSQE